MYGVSDNYVRVERPSGETNNIACGGDSGSPVFEYVFGGVDALGVLSSSNGGNCSGTAGSIFSYSPIDYINWSSYRILTTNYPLYLHQNVWWSPTNCIAYKRKLDAWGNPAGPQTSSACQTSLPAGSSGQIHSYTAYVIANQLREGMWRGETGYVRNVPLNADGTVDWASAPAWDCCFDDPAPEAQGVFIVGDHYKQNVWWSASNCVEYSRPLDNSGNPSGTQTDQPCQTSLPAGSSGSIETYTAYVASGHLREALWRGGKGYVRDVPLNATNTAVDWASAPGWTHCCGPEPAPAAQGAYILTHP